MEGNKTDKLKANFYIKIKFIRNSFSFYLNTFHCKASVVVYSSDYLIGTKKKKNYK